MIDHVVRAPASSANLGSGFDVLGMALDLFADVGCGDAPTGARQIDEFHPASVAFAAMGGEGSLWLRCSIPVARGLGFSGAVRVAGAALAAVQLSSDPATAIVAASNDILRITADLEGHGDNVAASLIGGVTGFVDGQIVSIPVGPTLAAARIVAWIPDVTTSTDSSRRALDTVVDRVDAIHNIGRAVQLVTAFARDEPALLGRATDDRLHQGHRLALVPGAAAAIDAGVAAGAWCAWLSGSGPTVALFCAAAQADAVAAALPSGGHTKTLAIDTLGTRILT